MSCRTTSTVVLRIVGTGKEADIFVDSIDVIPQLKSAIGTVQKVGKSALFSALRLRLTMLCFLYNFLLHLFKGISVDDRLVNIFENHQVFLRIITVSLIFERLGIGLELDDIVAIFLLLKNFVNGAVFPLARIGLRFLVTPANPFFVPVYDAV
mgnify:CR=1 FL=1